jgi:hypothetical protein
VTPKPESKALKGSAREEIIKAIFSKIGFSFKEEELSPSLRKTIGELAEQQDYLWRLYGEEKRHKETAQSALCFGVAASIIGWPFIFIGLVFFSTLALLFGLVTGVMGTLLCYSWYKRERRLLAETEDEISSCSSKLEEKISNLSDSIYSELSEVHEARIRPTLRHIMVNFAEIIQAAKGKGIILETIHCPHCAAPASLPKTGESFQCKHCGGTIHATNVFEMLKGILTPAR